MYGADYLAGCKYKKVMIENHPPGWASGIFLRTFGDARKTVEAMCNSGRFSQIVVHLAPFRSDHNYPKKLTPQMKQDAKWMNTLTGGRLMCSPFCESKGMSQAVYEELNEILVGSVDIVNSILPGAKEKEGTVTEVHIPRSNKLPKKPKQPYTVSFDGFGGDGSGNFTDTNIEAILDKYSDAIHIRWWDFALNLKVRWDDKTPIAQRTHKPDKHYILNRHHMMKDREGAVSWPKTALLKPSADYHFNGTSKDGKFMVIIPVDKPEVKVKDTKGNVIDTLKRFKPDFEGPPKGARYYSSKLAYQIAAQAEANTGSALVKVDNMPLTDGNLRSGLFR